jgi:hypothetical protein
MSGPTFARAKEIADAAAAEPEKFARLFEQMDETGKVNGVYKQLQTARATEQIVREPPPLPTGPFRVIVAPMRARSWLASQSLGHNTHPWIR